MRFLLAFVVLSACFSAEPDVIISRRAPADFELTADPFSPNWKGVAGVIATDSSRGRPTPGNRTEIRSRWTSEHLYFLFLCDYRRLNLKPDPVTDRETRRLWEWDVAEVFIGADFGHINRYREFEISPQGEYIDLDINSRDLNSDRDMEWDSGFEVKASLDRDRQRWCGEMKIPLAAIDSRLPKPGAELRVNFYRLQGPGPERDSIAWRPTGGSHHVPEAFGRLVLGN